MSDASGVGAGGAADKAAEVHKTEAPSAKGKDVNESSITFDASGGMGALKKTLVKHYGDAEGTKKFEMFQMGFLLTSLRSMQSSAKAALQQQKQNARLR